MLTLSQKLTTVAFLGFLNLLVLAIGVAGAGAFGAALGLTFVSASVFLTGKLAMH